MEGCPLGDGLHRLGTGQGNPSRWYFSFGETAIKLREGTPPGCKMAISKVFCQGGADFVAFSVGETGGRNLYSRRHEYPPDRPVVEWSKTAPHRTLPSGFLGSNPSWTDFLTIFVRSSIPARVTDKPGGVLRSFPSFSVAVRPIPTERHWSCTVATRVQFPLRMV